ncbi:MAG: MFS transporter [Opitutaceae bacterium]
MPPTPSPTPPTPTTRLTLRQLFAYGSGGILYEWGLFGLKNTANQVINIVLGVNPAAMGAVMAVGRLWDALVDPLVGNFSDNFRSRWGRRRPLIVAGALGCGLLFPLVWWIPAGAGPTVQVAWLFTATLLFYSAFAAFVVPYQALGYELTPDYHEKTRLFAVRQGIGALTGLAVAWVFPLILSGWFGAPRESAHAVALGIGLILAVTAAGPAIFVRARESASPLRQQRKVPIREAMKYAWQSRPFLLVAGGSGLATIGLNTVTALGPYINIYHVHGGDAKAASVIGGLQFTISVGFILLCTPLMSGLARWLGKRGALFVCLGLAMTGTISKWFLYTPEHPYWIIGVVFLLGPANVGLRIYADSMVADICEHETLRHGLRLEAMYGAVFAWMLKTGLALAVLASGFMLTLTGFDVELGGAQNPETMLWLRILFSYFPTAAIAASCALLGFYPLTAAHMAAVRAELDRRALGGEAGAPPNQGNHCP